MSEHPSFWKELQEILMAYGHIPIIGGIGWIAVALHKHGVKMTFDFRIWKNGKDKEQ